MMKRSPYNMFNIVAGIVVALCCCLIAILSGAVYVFHGVRNVFPTIAADPTVLPAGATPTPFEITHLPLEVDNYSTQRLIEQTIVPDRDLAELACRFKSICNIPPTVITPPAALERGAQTQFWLLNTDSNDYSRINVTLQYITPHAYFWVEDGVNFNPVDAKKLIDTFESSIYSTNREFFGSEWTPGVDGDLHIYIVYVRSLGDIYAGLFNSGDEYPPQLNLNSNAHESFYIASSQDLTFDYTYGTLAHEFQHMIHWYQDSNESSFLNEGFSELAVFLNGYDPGGFDWVYTSDPDINLTDWLGGSGDNSAHYGANFLFVTYYLDRFGKEATQALVHDQQNELASVDYVLKKLNITDALTREPVTADDFFLDWTLANYIHDPGVADGRYTYHNYPDSPATNDTEAVNYCPQAQSTRIVNQYGVDYIRFTCPGNFAINFTGSTLTRLLPTDPHSGSYAFWSNKGDESDMTLTRQFDLTGVSGPVTLSYWTWYDLERDYDYVYLGASFDGVSWKIIPTPSGTSTNPSGNSYGWGYNGQSNGWIQEKLDLSQFSGQVVSLRFEYITDEAATGEGFQLDDISIPEINYFEDFESGDGGWAGEGFVRIQNVLPQTFRLALITHSSNGTSVDILPVSADQTAQIPVQIGSSGVQDVVLVVTATTRFTREQAAYQFEIR
jgi:immune inhibitor A